MFMDPDLFDRRGVTLGLRRSTRRSVPHRAIATAAIWPWALTPLTGRAIGVWLFALGVAALHVAREDDHQRVRPAAVAYVILSVLQLVALARFPEDVDWSGPAGWVYFMFLL
jgi:hypothetical protein